MDTQFYRKAWAGAVLAASLFVARADSPADWRMYTSRDGLAESYCSTVSISQHGEIWVQHHQLSRVSFLDGYSVKRQRMNGLATPHLYESRVGQLWAQAPNGVMEWKDQNWTVYPIAEIQALPPGNTRLPLLPLRQGRLLFLLPDRLMELNVEPSKNGEVVPVRFAGQTGLEYFSDLIEAGDGGLWLTGRKGLAKIPPPRPADPQAAWQEFLIDSALPVENLQRPFEDDQGGITMVAETKTRGKKVIIYFDGRQWFSPPAEMADIRLAWRGVAQSFWFLAGRKLFHLQRHNDQWLAAEQHMAKEFYDAVSEPGGNFWVATSDGLLRYAPAAWRTAPGTENSDPPVAVLQERDGPLWVAHTNRLSRFLDEQWKDFYPPKTLAQPLQSRSLYSLRNGTLVAGNGRGLFRLNPRAEESSFIEHPAGSPLKTLGVMTNGWLCVQVLDPRLAANGPHLEMFDGATFHPLADLPAKWNLGTELSLFFTTQNGTLWIGGGGGMAFYRDQKWSKFEGTEAANIDPVLNMIETADGRLLAGTRDKIWQFNNSGWSVLRAGLSPANGFSRADDGSIWMATDNGVMRYFRGDWVGNGPDEGLPDPQVSQTVQDARGRIWAVTAGGLSVYHAEADPDAPQTYIEQTKNADVPTEGQLQFIFGGRDKWKKTDTNRLLFSHRLDEQEWSAFRPERTVAFSDLPRGPHFFQVRTMDRNWNVDPKPALVDILIPLPWYEETRLIWSAAIGGAVALFFAALAFNRHRRLVKSYAEVEKIVELRTHQLDKANQELFQGQKMNALGTLAAGIAHDFNSILSIIKGSTQIIESNLENQEKVRTRLDRIKTAVDQGAGIVKAMLGFSRTTETQTAWCDLNAIAGETIQLLGDRFQRDTEVNFQPGSHLPQVETTKDYVQQILLNLVLNASEAMNGPGQIQVSTGLLNRLPGDMVLTPFTAERYLYVAVQDFGVGISPEILPRIFEPFFTTKSLSARRGTGLGLSMVYELAKTMGAGLGVKSALGAGSTFMLVLPMRSGAGSKQI